MDKRLGEMEIARRRIMRFCGWLRWAFGGCLVLYCFAVAAIIFVAIFPPEGFNYTGPSSILLFLPLACNVFAGGLILFVIVQMLNTVKKGLSPFSLSSARLIKALAIILMIGVVSGVFIDPGMQFGAVSTSGSIALKSIGNENDVAYIDVRGLFLSIICFALSPIFRYGALLQSEADDLI